MTLLCFLHFTRSIPVIQDGQGAIQAALVDGRECYARLKSVFGENRFDNASKRKHVFASHRNHRRKPHETTLVAGGIHFTGGQWSAPIAPICKRQRYFRRDAFQHAVRSLQHFEHIRDVHLQEETENVRVPLQQLQFGIGKKADTIDFAPEYLPDSLLRRPDLSLTATYRAHTIPSPDIFLDRQPCSDRFLKRSSPGHLLPGVPLTHK